LNRCQEITDFGLKILGEGLQTLAFLTTLSLSFDLFDKITDAGLDSFGQAIQTLPHLTNLSLSFIKSVNLFQSHDELLE